MNYKEVLYKKADNKNLLYDYSTIIGKPITPRYPVSPTNNLKVIGNLLNLYFQDNITGQPEGFHELHNQYRHKMGLNYDLDAAEASIKDRERKLKLRRDAIQNIKRELNHLAKLQDPIPVIKGILMDPKLFAKNVNTGVRYGLVDYGSKLRDSIYATGMYSGLGLKLINDVLNDNIQGTNTITYDSNGKPIIKDGYKSDTSRTFNNYLDSFIKGTLDGSSYWNKHSLNYLQNIQKLNPTFKPTEDSDKFTTTAAGLTTAILGGKGVNAITPKALKLLVHLNTITTAITNGPAIVNGIGTATSSGQDIARPNISKAVSRAIKLNPFLKYIVPVSYIASKGLEKGRDGLNPIIRNWLPVFGRLASDPYALQNSKWFKPDLLRAVSGKLPTKFNINTLNGTTNVKFNALPLRNKVYIVSKPGQNDIRVGLGPKSIYSLATAVLNQPGAIPTVFDYTNPNETFVYQKFPMSLLHKYNDTRAARINANNRLIAALLKK